MFDDDTTSPHGMKMVLLAQQANAEAQFEELIRRLNVLPELPPTMVLKLRAELGTLIETLERLNKLLSVTGRPGP